MPLHKFHAGAAFLSRSPCDEIALIMKISRPLLAALLSALAIAPSSAGPAVKGVMPPRVPPQAAPAVGVNIDAAALVVVNDMIARYTALRSYSDLTQVLWEDATGKQARLDDGLNFTATLQWQRPGNIRFEGIGKTGSFLAVADDKNLFVTSPDHPGYYLSRVRRRTTTFVTAEDGTQTEVTPPGNFQLDEPLMEVPAGGPSMGFINDPGFWKRSLTDVRALSLAPDQNVKGEPCRVVNLQLAFDDGGKAIENLFIAKSDGLLRRTEHNDSRMGGGLHIAETHTNVRVNPDLLAGTWEFKPLTGAKPIEYFVNLDPHQFDPALKVGDLLPTFSGDALNGEPLELNSKSGKVTVVYFFTMSTGLYDAQILKKMDRIIGHDKLQIIGVSGDGARDRMEKFVEHYKLPFPIYFDERGMHNPLAQKFGIKGWDTTLIFGNDGKLKTTADGPSAPNFQKTVQNLLPGTPGDAFIVQDKEMIAPQ